MDPAKFLAKEFGELSRQFGEKWSFWYFSPAPMPRELSLPSETILLLSNADVSLGRLSGVGRLLNDIGVLVRPYLAKEALASSRIEGTQASLSDVLQAAINDEPVANADLREIFNYQAAVDKGIELLPTLPISIRLLKELHTVLLAGARGEERLPGELRRSPVWIGGSSPDNAIFVPPVPDEMEVALADWERFVNEPSPMLPLLVRCALMHYQFETIHPFLDGNGRMGRLLIILMLIEQKALSAPLLYVSAYMERNRRDYYDTLQAVRERGEIQGWIRYFLRAIAEQAEDSANRIEQLVDLREGYRQELYGERSRAVEVMELCFANPFITVKRIQKELQITNQGARNLIESLRRRGWLRKVAMTGRGGRIYWVNDSVSKIIMSTDIDQPA